MAREKFAFLSPAPATGHCAMSRHTRKKKHIFGSTVLNSLIQTVKCSPLIKQDLHSKFVRCADNIYLIFLEGIVYIFIKHAPVSLCP